MSTEKYLIHVGEISEIEARMKVGKMWVPIREFVFGICPGWQTNALTEAQTIRVSAGTSNSLPQHVVDVSENYAGYNLLRIRLSMEQNSFAPSVHTENSENDSKVCYSCAVIDLNINALQQTQICEQRFCNGDQRDIKLEVSFKIDPMLEGKTSLVNTDPRIQNMQINHNISQNEIFDILDAQNKPTPREDEETIMKEAEVRKNAISAVVGELSNKECAETIKQFVFEIQDTNTAESRNKSNTKILTLDAKQMAKISDFHAELRSDLCFTKKDVDNIIRASVKILEEHNIPVISGNMTKSLNELIAKGRRDDIAKAVHLVISEDTSTQGVYESDPKLSGAKKETKAKFWSATFTPDGETQDYFGLENIATQLTNKLNLPTDASPYQTASTLLPDVDVHRDCEDSMRALKSKIENMKNINQHHATQLVTKYVQQSPHFTSNAEKEDIVNVVTTCLETVKAWCKNVSLAETIMFAGADRVDAHAAEKNYSQENSEVTAKSCFQTMKYHMQNKNWAGHCMGTCVKLTQIGQMKVGDRIVNVNSIKIEDPFFTEGTSSTQMIKEDVIFGVINASSSDNELNTKLKQINNSKISQTDAIDIRGELHALSMSKATNCNAKAVKNLNLKGECFYKMIVTLNGQQCLTTETPVFDIDKVNSRTSNRLGTKDTWKDMGKNIFPGVSVFGHFNGLDGHSIAVDCPLQDQETQALRRQAESAISNYPDKSITMNTLPESMSFLEVLPLTWFQRVRMDSKNFSRLSSVVSPNSNTMKIVVNGWLSDTYDIDQEMNARILYAQTAKATSMENISWRSFSLQFETK